jgi:hypothetical protein
MSGTFVKLFGSILNSSMWCADGDTRLVWITMLLLADADGNVWGAIPGVARQAGVEVDACRRAIDYLSAPDPDSRSSELEGRRIVPIDGGWRVVNARKYREMQTSGQRKASERSRRYRANKERMTQRDRRDASRLSRIEGESEPESEPEERYAAAGAITAARPPASPAPSGDDAPLDFDPTDELEARVAARVADLAARTDTAPSDILAAVSATKDGKTLDRIRGAPRPWLATTLSTCDRFASENL